MIEKIKDRVARSTALYPASLAYVCGVVAMCLYASHVIDLAAAIAGFGVAVVIVIMSVVRNEVAVVHEMVNSQRDALVERIDSLAARLIEAGEPLPPDPKAPKVAQAEQETHTT